jgi:hypothetical protein
MIPVIPPSISIILLVSNLAIAYTLWRILAAGVSTAGLPAATARTARVSIGAFLAAWLGAALLLAPSPESLVGQDPFTLTPLIPLFNVLPLAIIAAAFRYSPTLRRIVAATPLPSLIGIQFYRALGAVFLVVMALGQLPAYFAVPAGWGDVAVGLAAPLVAVAVARQASGSRALAIGWKPGRTPGSARGGGHGYRQAGAVPGARARSSRAGGRRDGDVPPDPRADLRGTAVGCPAPHHARQASQRPCGCWARGGHGLAFMGCLVFN